MALTEYILAVSLTALIFVACLATLPTLWMSQTQAIHRSEANLRAQGLLEQQKHRNFQELRGLTETPLTTGPFADQTILEGLLQVWPVPGCDQALKLRVVLSWKEGRRPCRTIRETLVTSLSR